jgi:outer membrane protein
MNKIFSLMAIFSVVLMVACDSKPSTNNVPDAKNVPSAAGSKIVWVNIDTLLKRYELTKDQRDSLEQAAAKEEKAFTAKAEAFQKRYLAVQKEVYDIQQKANTIPPIELQALEQKYKSKAESLAKEEEALNIQREQANQKLNKKLAEVDKDLINRVNTYLEKVAAEKGYEYILMKGSGGGVLFGNKSLEVTDAIVEALNAEYKAIKK